MTWGVRYTPGTERQLDALERTLRRRIQNALARLALDPHASPNVTALQGGGYRLRVGDWRVLYTLRGDMLLIVVLKIAHRREAYR